MCLKLIQENFAKDLQKEGTSCKKLHLSSSMQKPDIEGFKDKSYISSQDRKHKACIRYYASVQKAITRPLNIITLLFFYQS